MKREVSSAGWQARFLRRTALAVCHPADRPWIEALFAELEVLDGLLPRAAWMSGIGHLIATRIRDRGVAILRSRIQAALLLLLCAALFSGLVAELGFESMGVDDDLFFATSVALGAALIYRIAAAWKRTVQARIQPAQQSS